MLQTINYGKPRYTSKDQQYIYLLICRSDNSWEKSNEEKSNYNRTLYKSVFTPNASKSPETSYTKGLQISYNYLQFSTDTNNNSINLKNDWMLHLQQNSFGTAVFLHISQAFDKVWLSGQLHKIKKIFLRTSLQYLNYISLTDSLL